MNRFLSRVLAVTLCCVLLLEALPAGQALASAGDGKVTYRALLIGNAKYDNGQTLQGPAFDVQHMEQLLLQQDFSGSRFEPSGIIKLNNATKLQILNAITKQLASMADGDDVTYFYYSGHGTYDGSTSYLVGSEMGLISIDEIKAALDRVPGRKVVILDSCYSGGYAGRGVGSAQPQGSAWKETDTKTAVQKAAPADEAAGFQAGVLKPFDKPQGLMARAAMTTSSYRVITAASAFQYSYEYQFNDDYSGSPCYGPNFIMNGHDWASGPENYSGEFTGMLVAATGCVTFNPVFPEIQALADVNRDRVITLDELYRYLRGAVLYSTVQVYPERDNSAVFEHSAADTPDWDQPALYAYDNSAPHSPDSFTPVRFDLLCSKDWPRQITIKKIVKVGDNRYADNADINETDVATLQTAEQAPDGSTAAVVWDGTATDGSQAGDGWYFAEVSSDAYKFPPVPFELSRGVSNFPAASALPMNATFTASLPGIGSKRWYSFTPSSDGLFRLQSTNGGAEKDPEAELFDADGDSLAWSGDIMLPNGDNDCNFELLRYLQAGQKYFVCVSLDDGTNISLSVFSRYTLLSPDNTLTKADTSKTSYTLFRPDTSGLWTIEAKGQLDDSNTGITLYDTRFDTVAYGERSPESYRYICSYLDAGKTYILETPKVSTSLQVAAYGPGKLPALTTSSMPALTVQTATSVSIAHAYDTKLFHFTPTASGVYRFESTSPIDGSGKVDSYAFLLDSRGAVLASDDDVNYDRHELQFDFSAPLAAGVTYVLAVRAYVPTGRLTASNPTLDFSVRVSAAGAAAQTQAVSEIATGEDSVVALYDNDGVLSNGIGSGGLLSGWGSGVEGGFDGLTGFDFGEGQYMLRRWTPELLSAPGGTEFTALWKVGQAFVARDAGQGCYVWGVGSDGTGYCAITRLDNSANGLANHDISDMVQGSNQSEIYFLDKTSGKVYVMSSLDAVPATVSGALASCKKIAVTSGSLLALGADGTLYAKGTNRYGECGTGGTNTVANLTVVNLPEKITGFATGDNHVLALGASGNVYAWGCNDFGSLGLGRTDRVVTSPARVSFGSLLATGERIVNVFAGGNCSAALTSTGRVFAWGDGDHGQLGIGGTFSQDAPKQVQSLSPTALGSGRKITDVVFGPESAYAIASDGSVYVSGRDDYGQLGFVSGDVETFAQLTRPNIKSSNNSLQTLTLSVGTLSPSFSPGTLEYNVIMPQGVALSTVQAVKADSTAAMKIDGQAATSKTVNAGPGPVKTQIAVTAQDGTTQTYVLDFPQSPSANAYLSNMTLSAGSMVTPLNQASTDYAIWIPETMSKPVTITPVPADPNASYTINGMKGIKSTTVSLPLNGMETIHVLVTSQLGNTRAYTFTIIRKALVTGFSGSPVYAGYASLSPGGTDTLTFQYSLSSPATVKLEVKRGSRWVTVLKHAEPAAGAKTFTWNGKEGGRTLRPGTYQARITPYYAGAAGAPMSLTLKILPRPAITVYSFYPSAFTVNGVNTLRINFRWSRISDVRVQVLTSSGKVAATVYNAVNCAPQTLTLRWDGRNAAGALLPSGNYKVRIICGGSSLDLKFRIKS